MINEIWKPVLGYEGLYEVSNYGNVKSQERYVKSSYNSVTLKKEKILKPTTARGYLKVDLYVCRKRTMKYVARLVWEAFNGPIPEGMQVNHINEDKTDNRLENLNLMTSKENNNWGTHNERVARHFEKKVLQLRKDGTFIKEWDSVRSITRTLGYNEGNISSCCLNRKHFNSAYGFKWQYKE